VVTRRYFDLVGVRVAAAVQGVFFACYQSAGSDEQLTAALSPTQKL